MRLMKSWSGFTLTEILIATALFAMITPFIFSGFMASSRQVMPETRETIGYGLAKEQLERMREDVQIFPGSGLALTGNVYDTGTAVDQFGTPYTTQRNVSTVTSRSVGGAASLTDYRRADIRVSWDYNE